jgi:hypothetical protein
MPDPLKALAIVGDRWRYKTSRRIGIVQKIDDERGFFMFPEGGNAKLDGGWWTGEELLAEFSRVAPLRQERKK